MRTITTRYGNTNLTEDHTLDLGARSVGDQCYGYARFHKSNTEFRTRLVDDVTALKTFLSAVAKQVKTDNFPFENEHGQKQWHTLNSSNPSL